MLIAPQIRSVNEFLMKFLESPETEVHFCEEDLVEANGNLSPLRGVDYEKVRLRLRVICNLDPVVNRETDEGIIRFKTQTREIEFRATFAAKGTSIALEKINPVQP